MLAAQLRARHTAFGLAENWKNLGFAISRHLHQNLLRYLAEKIPLQHPLSFGGDYQCYPVADRYGTNYPPEFLYQAMVAQHQVQEWGDFD